MKKGFPINQGKETWKLLERIRNQGYSYFFTDFLDLILDSLLSMTENIQEVHSKQDINQISKGQYNDRYMEIVKKYPRSKGQKVGEGTIDLFSKAWGILYKETLESKKDVLGEIFQAQISYGEHSQFFTPEHITDVMSELVGKEVTESKQTVTKTVTKTVMDPCCGSGRFLLSRAKKHPEDYFIGQDIDERCCKMAVINLWMFDLTGEIRQGDSLTGRINKRWIIRKGGYVYEYLEPKIDYYSKKDEIKIEKQLTL